MNERIWMVVDEKYSDAGVLMDEDCEFFDSAVESQKRAREQWEQLSARDQQNRRIYNAVISVDDLSEDAFDDSGNIYWYKWESFRYPDSYQFDSAEED